MYNNTSNMDKDKGGDFYFKWDVHVICWFIFKIMWIILSSASLIAQWVPPLLPTQWLPSFVANTSVDIMTLTVVPPFSCSRDLECFCWLYWASRLYHRCIAHWNSLSGPGMTCQHMLAIMFCQTFLWGDVVNLLQKELFVSQWMTFCRILQQL